MGAVRDEELLDFASLYYKGKSFLIGVREGDTTPVLIVPHWSPIVSFSCNITSFVPS